MVAQRIDLSSTTPLHQLIDRMKPLQVILAQNTYIKDTTRRLQTMIDDASDHKRVLFIGNNGVGKTTVINSLLGRDILSVSLDQPTMANTFIRYGKEECVRAHFLDGMIATFDISKIELLTTAMTESAQIIREHMEFVEVILDNPIVQHVTFVDSIALQQTDSGVAFLSEVLVERIDDILWVVRHNQPATDAEITLMQQYAMQDRKPYIIVNATDESPETVQAFLADEQQRYGHFVQGMQAISAKEALQQDSDVEQLHVLVDELQQDTTTKAKHLVKRFVDWLERCQIEFENIPQKEPYLSAMQSIIDMYGGDNVEYTRQERDKAILHTCEQEYAQVCEVFKSVETLYQLLQQLKAQLYLRNEQIEMFEDVALRYQMAVRQYRKLHMEYVQAYGQLDQQHRKTFGKGIEKADEATFATNTILHTAMINIDDKQKKLEALHRQIKAYEQGVLSQLYSVQNHLNDLAQKRLAIILNQVAELNVQRKHEMSNTKSSVQKLAEFSCIEEAQNFIKETILPYLQTGALPLTDGQFQQATTSIHKLLQVELKQQAAEFEQFEQSGEHLLQHDFEATYQFVPLRLTEANVLSEIPECPNALL